LPEVLTVNRAEFVERISVAYLPVPGLGFSVADYARSHVAQAMAVE
jgi:hypothetical protein